MKISELKTGQGNVDVSGVIKEMGEVRTFNKFGRELRVVNAILEDDSGNIKLTLWNQDVDNFSEGDQIKIVNGYVGEFQGEKQLTSGKFGKIEKVEGSSSDKKEGKKMKKDFDEGSDEDDKDDEESDEDEEMMEGESDVPYDGTRA